MFILNSANNINWRLSLVFNIGGEDIDVSKYIQNISIPDISLDSVSSGYQNRMAQFAADTPKYGDLDVEFILTDDYYIYRTMYKYIRQLNDTSTPAPYGFLTLELLDSYQDKVFGLEFSNVLLKNLGGFELNTYAELEELKLSATFGFSEISFEDNDRMMPLNSVE